jgi:hypothetical protein
MLSSRCVASLYPAFLLVLLDIHQWLVLFAAAVLSFGEAFNTTALTVFAVPIKQRYGVNNEDLGLLFGTRKALCIASPILAGIAIRKWGTQAIFVTGAYRTLPRSLAASLIYMELNPLARDAGLFICLVPSLSPSRMCVSRRGNNGTRHSY